MGQLCQRQFHFVLQSCPCALALAVGQRTVPGPPGARGSRVPAAVGWASSVACGRTIPPGLVDTGAQTSLQPTRSAASATCVLAQVRHTGSIGFHLSPSSRLLLGGLATHSFPGTLPAQGCHIHLSSQAQAETHKLCEILFLSRSHGAVLSNTVPGGWSRWSPWSWCDRSCGGGRSLRTRSCLSPPPKNGGASCAGERHHTRVCNALPCGKTWATPGVWREKGCYFPDWLRKWRALDVGIRI